MVEVVNKILGISTVVSHVILIIGFVYYLVLGRKGKDNIIMFLGKHGLKFAFFFAFLATAASLFYSDIAGYVPCVLCWYQRIFMYPLVILFGMAWAKKDSKILSYTTVLASLGLLISLYHNYISMGGTELFSCDNSGVSCLRQYVFEYDYVTIPSMAFTAFVLILVFTKLQKIYDRNTSKQS